ncbi:hypothetical protein ASG22_16985 [Chryseobacterium sp. Leaf405]|uniref:hypothetical protein n=1 Tax=Chryseobacterium sp. Leaf405 TaxID=1736367 RepID=UPI0006F2B3E3|nr:hypothetical protein [Chryseobacterium sp. Leaf405]KQT20669.1 hypothetical protein ASG22_16985 [Chryseobacterium sp. Leaf405]
MFFIYETAFSQINKNNCSYELSFFAYNLPIDEVDWYVPIKYNITGEFIDLNIRKENKDELYILFKIIETLKCDFRDVNDCDLKYKILTYDEDTDSFGERQSEIEFKFSDGEGKIYVRHPNFPEISSDATTFEKE